MSCSFTLGPLADQSRMIRMGDRFRSGSDGIDVGQIVTFALIFAALALVLWLMTSGSSMCSRFCHRSPTMLFWELCQAHQIGWRIRWQLWVFAVSSHLENPARLFVEPQLLNDKVLAAWPDAHRQKLTQLRDALFE